MFSIYAYIQWLVDFPERYLNLVLTKFEFSIGCIGLMGVLFFILFIYQQRIPVRKEKKKVDLEHKVKTIPTSFLETSKERGYQIAYSFRNSFDVWEDVTWLQYGAKVTKFAKALVGTLELDERACLAIFGSNRPQWAIGCLGALISGCTVAPMYSSFAEEQIYEALLKSQAKWILVDSKQSYEKVISVVKDKRLPLEYIILMSDTLDNACTVEKIEVCDWDEFLKRGIYVEDREIFEISKSITLQDEAIHLFSSNNSKRKSVILTHKNIAFAANSLFQNMLNLSKCKHIKQHRMLSYLPLAHVVGLMMDIILPCVAGTQIYFESDNKALMKGLASARPTVFLAIPRLWNKFRNLLVSRFRNYYGIKRIAITWCMSVAVRSQQILDNGGELNFLQNFKQKLANRISLKRIHHAVGWDQCVLFLSGISPLSDETSKFFNGMNISIQHFFNEITESSGIASDLVGSNSSNDWIEWELGC